MLHQTSLNNKKETVTTVTLKTKWKGQNNLKSQENMKLKVRLERLRTEQAIHSETKCYRDGITLSKHVKTESSIWFVMWNIKNIQMKGHWGSVLCASCQQWVSNSENFDLSLSPYGYCHSTMLVFSGLLWQFILNSSCKVQCTPVHFNRKQK